MSSRSPPKLQMPESESVKQCIRRVEVSAWLLSWQDVIMEAQGQLREYKKEIEMLRQEINLMENHLTTQNDENVKIINPFIMSNFDDLTDQITRQRNENENMQRQIVELKKDKSLIQQSIMHASQKIA